MSLAKRVQKINLESIEEIDPTEPEVTSDTLEMDIADDVGEIANIHNDIEATTDITEELNDLNSDVEEKIDQVDNIDPEQPDPVDIAVVNESINYYCKVLGVTRSTTIALEDIRSSAPHTVESLKVELEGIKDTIVDYSKKAWEKILEFLRMLGAKLKELWNKIKEFVRPTKQKLQTQKQVLQLKLDIINEAVKETTNEQPTPMVVLNSDLKSYYKQLVASKAEDLKANKQEVKESLKEEIKALPDLRITPKDNKDYIYATIGYENCVTIYETVIKKILPEMFKAFDTLDLDNLNELEEFENKLSDIIAKYFKNLKVDNKDALNKTYNGKPSDVLGYIPIQYTGYDLVITYTYPNGEQLSRIYNNTGLQDKNTPQFDKNMFNIGYIEKVFDRASSLAIAVEKDYSIYAGKYEKFLAKARNKGDNLREERKALRNDPAAEQASLENTQKIDRLNAITQGYLIKTYVTTFLQVFEQLQTFNTNLIRLVGSL